MVRQEKLARSSRWKTGAGRQWRALAIRKTTTRAAPGDAGAHVETRPVRQPCRRKQGIRGSDAGNVDAVQGAVPWRRAHAAMAPEETARRRGCKLRRCA